MTTEVLDQYRRLMNELLIVREAEGGELPIEIESAYVERLDDLWWQLSVEEQAAYEKELASESSPPSQESLRLVDCEVSQGEQTSPRRKAA